MNLKRKMILAGNWKMNGSRQESLSFLKDLSLPLHSEIDFLIFPPFLSLDVSVKAAPSPLKIGAQNAHWEKKGAFTGEISGPMLQELGIHWILLGHSERRTLFHESQELIFKKAQSLLEQGFQIIFCVGETLAQRQSKETREILKNQLDQLFSWNLITRFLPQLFIAYEPVWAIGTGMTASPEQANETHLWIRETLQEKISTAADRVSILYGGSVTPENLPSLLACPEIDGALVGGASLKQESFSKMIQIFQAYS